nr:putative cladoceran-specific protein type 1 [Daphnia magna]
MVRLGASSIAQNLPTTNEQPHFRTVQNPKRVHENQLLDVQLRNKLGNSRYWPSFLEQLKPQFNPRIIINLANRTNLLNKVKTITFTFTSSLTFTSVQSCIPSTDFFPGFNAVACRKRRGLVESSDLGTSQFTITPSDVQPMEPNVLSWLDPSVENRQSGNNPTVNANVVSSKDDGTLDKWQSVTLKPLGHYSRGKRLYLHFVTTKTAISYTSLSTTLTKTVNLLNPFFGAGQLVCLPQGYAVCPNNATSFPR